MSSGMWGGGDELFGTRSQETPDFTVRLPTLRKVYVTLHSAALSYSATILMINAALGGRAIARKGGLALAESNSLCCFTKTGCWLMPGPIGRTERSPGFLSAKGYRTSSQK
jgi:hypothetical protein